ncbi:hypothetical protein DL89DRAFT_128974 [Linderina pennispora]|uniref:Uncharacterized protein n=1 Tax=Linderina pennispora TaxID=61395 RepID=A0A1Y1WDI6_9FUNG|nr:uncharacterized protein DL89DRAFT_128974 [Linderina pennispora]ORX71589.1 hypothetical protein DL89DRAFT_128974 [Linderina pennispora]
MSESFTTQVGSRTADCDKEAAAGIVSAAAAASAGPSDSGVTISTSSACESSLMIGAASALAGDSKSVAANAIPTASGVVAGMQSLVHHSAATRISPGALGISGRWLGCGVCDKRLGIGGIVAAMPRCEAARLRFVDLAYGSRRGHSVRKKDLSLRDHPLWDWWRAGELSAVHVGSSLTSGGGTMRLRQPALLRVGQLASRKRSSSTRAATGGIYRSRASARISSASVFFHVFLHSLVSPLHLI